MFRLKQVFTIFIFSFFLLSCAETAYFIKDGSKVRLYKKTDENTASFLFRKKDEPVSSDVDLYFKAHINNTRSPFLFKILLDKGDKKIEISAVNAEKNILFFKIPAGNVLNGFILEAESLPHLEGIDLVEPENYFSGIKNSNEEYLKGDTVSEKINNGEYVFKYVIPDFNSRCCEIIIDFDYHSEHNSDEKINIVLSGKDNKKSEFEYTPLHGKNNIILNSRLFGFLPTEIEISGEKERLYLKNVYTDDTACTEYGRNLNVPFKTGFGPILISEKASWRNDEYEIFSWTHFPDFLIIDTADYSFQARMFKRLAFFVEKPGSRGIIRSNEEIEDLHGWNAHDYKAEDLAAFFTAASRSSFPLNKEEELLKEILTVNGVVRNKNGFFLPGSGGILSVSRESNSFLRRIFITHEGYHGVFFSSPEFRKKCEVIWEGVEPELKEFWELFFLYKRYDTEDQYLLVNEFMAYNLQQPTEKVIPYFFDHIIPRLLKRYPEKEEFLNTILNEKKDRFLYHAEKLAEALEEVTSLPAGSLILLNRISR